MKKVTDPLDAAVRASLMSSCSCNNSGDDIPSSEMESLDEFWSVNKDDIQSCSSSDSASSSSEEEDEEKEGKVAIDDNNKDHKLRELESLLSRYRYNHLLATLHNVAIKAPEDNVQVRRKEVTECIKAMGYDAGICRCKCNWNPNKSRAKKRDISYEYVDVVVGQERYIIDIAFAEQFTMGRSTDRYTCFLTLLPPVFVGSVKTLEKIVTVMNGEMRRSLRDMGMFVPPWRKRKYMNSMWFGPYTRAPSQSKINEAPLQQKWAPPSLGVRTATMSVLSRAVFTGHGK